jgi:phosphoglycerate dehydrogenase-like enzyme
MKIVAVDNVPLFPEDLAEIELLGEFIGYTDTPQSLEETIRRANNAEILISSTIQFDRTVLSQLPAVKLICITSAGYDRITIQAASEMKILVAHLPGHNMNAVAEYTIGMLIAASRLILRSAVDVQKGEFDQFRYLGRELSQKKLAVIGYGTIGKRVAEIARSAFDMQILSYDIGNSQEELFEILEQADYITLHLALNDQTRGLFDSEAFSHVKSNAVLVNAARGGLVVEKALYSALTDGKLFAAGLDVMVDEPYDLHNPLFSLPNIIITPHTAWNTMETKVRWSAQIVGVVQSYIKGSPQFIVREQQALLSSLMT